MRLVARYLKPGDPGRLRWSRLLLVVGVGGAVTLNAGVVAEAVGYEYGHGDVAFVAFLASLLLFRILYSLINAAFRDLTEKTIGHVRARITAHLERLSWPVLMALGRDRVFFTAFATVRQVSQMARLSARLVLNGGGIAWTIVALLLLSPTVLFGYLLLLVVLGLGYLYQESSVRGHLRRAQEHEERVSDAIESLLAGFQELKLHRPKADAFFAEEISTQIAACSAVRASANKQALVVYGVFQVFQFIAVGLCIFAIAVIFPHLAEDASEAALLIAFVPIGLLRDFPLIARADQALYSFEALEDEMARTAAAGIAAPEPEAGGYAFQELALEEVAFTYQGADNEQPFHLGPLSCRFEAGKIHFLTGGNGSGKSTLLTVLTGLQRPDKGTIRLNGQLVDMERWGDLFSPVFFDFHLFQRLLGLGHVDPDRVREVLAYLQIDDKTGFDPDGGRFTTQRLSTGQRRRLALVVALLEDRPVFVFDEWAADQDPSFRDRFYRRLLPDLRARGKTVIAATHDDRYFHTADQLIHMEDGLITPRR